MAVTHEVTNQPPPLAGHDVFDVDAAVVEAFDRHRRQDARAELHGLGRLAGSPGARLADSALMRNVLADIAVESEAATTLAMRLASTMDAPSDPHERFLRRVGLPLAKYWVCKRTVPVVAEAVEVLGGNGYVEDSDLPRLYREAPLNSIWEGASHPDSVTGLARVLAERMTILLQASLLIRFAPDPVLEVDVFVVIR